MFSLPHDLFDYRQLYTNTMEFLLRQCLVAVVQLNEESQGRMPLYYHPFNTF